LSTLRENLALRFVAPFGSYATERHTVASDIDVLIVYGGEHREDAYVLCKKVLSVPHLEAHEYSEKEYERIQRAMQRMLKNSVVIYSGTDHTQ